MGRSREWAMRNIRVPRKSRQVKKNDAKTVDFLREQAGTKLGYILPSEREFKGANRNVKNAWNYLIDRYKNGDDNVKGDAIDRMLYIGSTPFADQTNFSYDKQQSINNLQMTIRQFEDLQGGRKSLNKGTGNKTMDAFNALPESELKRVMVDENGNNHIQQFDTLDTSSEFIGQQVKNLDAYDHDGYTVVVDRDKKPRSGKGSGRFVFGSDRSVDEVTTEIIESMIKSDRSQSWKSTKGMQMFNKAIDKL